MLIISLFVWFAGPLGTFQAMDPLFRGVYWGGLIFGSVPFAYAFRVAITRQFPHLSLWSHAFLVATGFSFAYTPVVFLATLLAAQSGLADMVPLWVMWGGTFLAAASAYTVRTLLVIEDLEQQAGETPNVAPLPRLLHRIDQALHGRLISISVRDHYVDVRTEAGQVSLLMRLSDAIAETEGVDGAQVHRSHWVAWEAVDGVERDGGNFVLRLSQGVRIPVSRNHREKLEDRGLI